jgi:hypothetical protein
MYESMTHIKEANCCKSGACRWEAAPLQAVVHMISQTMNKSQITDKNLNSRQLTQAPPTSI